MPFFSGVHMSKMGQSTHEQSASSKLVKEKSLVTTRFYVGNKFVVCLFQCKCMRANDQSKTDFPELNSVDGRPSGRYFEP